MVNCNRMFFCSPCATSYGSIAKTCLSYDYVEYLVYLLAVYTVKLRIEAPGFYQYK